MKAIVTGAAGFIGSHLADRLAAEGHDVVGVDCLNNVYPSSLKKYYLGELAAHDRFKFVQTDLRTDDLHELVSGANVVFHLAAIPGVRASWSSGFQAYAESNIIGTQRLLEAVKSDGNARIVYASSSSVYGNADHYPVVEDGPLQPLSPYGVSKLSAEYLCTSYTEAFGLASVCLRFFSVYGPRQRPDMAVHKLIEAALRGHKFTVFGTGEQMRDMTFVTDVVDACVRAAVGPMPSTRIMNVAGGSESSLADLIERVQRLTGLEVPLVFKDAQAGDVRRTAGDTSRARTTLGWAPAVALEEGLRRQVEWHRMAADALRPAAQATIPAQP